MSRDFLQLLRDRSAFDPAPRHSELHDVHVPFDDLLGTGTCENALVAGVRRGERIALVGASGSGKSSIIAGTLGPLVEGVFPISVPVAVERGEVATDTVEFVRHVVRTVSRMISAQLPALGRTGRQLAEGAEQPPERISRFTASLPLPASLRPALAYELNRIAREPAPTGAQVIDQGRALLELVADDGLTPVLVLDDTDRWLSSLRTDSEALRRRFFTTVPRLLAEDLAVPAVVAVHPTYLADSAYRDARGFLSTTINVPAVPGPSGLIRVLGRRVEIACYDIESTPDERHAIQRAATQVLTPAAGQRLFDHYASGPSDLRRNVLLVAHTALALALDDDAGQLEQGHVELAVTS